MDSSTTAFPEIRVRGGGPVTTVAVVRDEPSGLGVDDVARWLGGRWGIEPVAVSYAPVGFGSYHWVAADRDGPRWFVTADHLAAHGNWLGPTADAVFAALTAAAQVTRELADRGYEFVLAGLPDRAGVLVPRVRPDWALRVFPYQPGWSTSDGEWEDPGERVRIAGVIGRLHAALPPDCLRRWDFTIPARTGLRSALADLDRPWTGGPYAEPTRSLLRETRGSIRTRLARYDDLVREIATSPEPWVVTHGEPHSANAIRTDDGRLCLIDWDTVALAPRERDLAGIVDGTGEAVTAYRGGAGPVTPRPAALELFTLWWALAEICGYVLLFRDPHTDSADAAESWRNLRHYAEPRG
jgi:spectinomycin phosphotransferase